MLGSIAQNIREARKRIGITQAKLAKQVNMHRNTIINFETGHRNPRVKDLKRIATALNVPVEELISD